MVGRVGGAAIIEPATPRPNRTRSTPLDDPNATLPTPTPAPPPWAAAAAPRAAAAHRKPPGLRDQLKATRMPPIALVLAHVELAKAEAGQIAGEVGRVAALGALAIALVIFAVFLRRHRHLAVARRVAARLDGLGRPPRLPAVRLGRDGGRARRARHRPEAARRRLCVAVVVAVVVGVVLGLGLLNQLYASIGDALGFAVDPGIRPLVVGMLLVGSSACSPASWRPS